MLKYIFKINGLIVDEITTVNSYLDKYLYNSKINKLKMQNPLSDIRIRIDNDLYVSFIGDKYVVKDSDGNDLSKELPNELCVINFPNLSYEYSDLDKKVTYKLDGIEFNEVLCISTPIKIEKIKPIRFNRSKYIISNGVILGKKLYFKDINGIPEFEGSTSTFQIKLNKKDNSIIKKLTPILMELNNINNRVIPGLEILNCVNFEFTEFGHLTGRLTRQRRHITDENEWFRLVEEIIPNLKELPLIARNSELMNYDALNPNEYNGSILSGESEYGSIDEYMESLNISLDHYRSMHNL